jgi:hypothetical protein
MVGWWSHSPQNAVAHVSGVNLDIAGVHNYSGAKARPEAHASLMPAQDRSDASMTVDAGGVTFV